MDSSNSNIEIVNTPRPLKRCCIKQEQPPSSMPSDIYHNTYHTYNPFL